MLADFATSEQSRKRLSNSTVIRFLVLSNAYPLLLRSHDCVVCPFACRLSQQLFVVSLYFDCLLRLLVIPPAHFVIWSLHRYLGNTRLLSRLLRNKQTNKQAASSGSACRCSYKGIYTCSGSETGCRHPDSRYCKNPDESVQFPRWRRLRRLLGSTLTRRLQIFTIGFFTTCSSSSDGPICNLLKYNLVPIWFMVKESMTQVTWHRNTLPNNWNKKVLRLAGQRLLHIDKEVTCHLISLFVPGTFNGKTQWENPTSMGKPKS